MIPLPCTTWRDLFAIASLLLLGCSQGPYCALYVDGAEVVTFNERVVDASCAVVRFPEFVNVIVDKGANHYSVVAPYNDDEARADSRVNWSAGLAQCMNAPASAEWSQKDDGFDFTLELDCGGTPVHARFFGSL